MNFLHAFTWTFLDSQPRKKVLKFIESIVQYDRSAIYESRRPQRRGTLLLWHLLMFVCLLLNLGHFGQKWPLHADNVYAVVDVGAIYVS